MSNDQLDECHGHTHDFLGYHYHATIEYPYTVGCYRGNMNETSSFQSDHEIERQNENRKKRRFLGSDPLQLVAQELDVEVEVLRKAIGPPPPNFRRGARILNIDEELLRRTFEKHRKP